MTPSRRVCEQAMPRVVALFLIFPASLTHAQGREDRKSESGLEYTFFRAGSRAPLLVCLHGTGGNRALFGPYKDEAVKRGFMVAVPKSTGSGTPQSGNTSGDSSPRWDFVDVPKVVGLVRELIRKEGADPKRIYLMGYSNGGWFTYHIGLSNPEIFAGICVIGGGMAGTPYAGKEEIAREMGIYIIHGTADGSVPVARAREAEKNLKEAGFKNVVYKEYEGAGHELFYGEVGPLFDFWAKHFKKVKPGSNRTLPWRDASAIENLGDSFGILYFYSPKDEAHRAVECFEWELFPAPEVIQATSSCKWIRVNRDAEPALAKQFRANGPCLVIVKPDKKVAAVFSSPTTVSAFCKKIKALLQGAKGS